MQGVQPFGEFLDELTVGGFFNQTGAGVGQLTASAISTISGGGGCVLTALAGRTVLGNSNRAATKKIISEALEKTAKGTADTQDTEIAQMAWDLSSGAQ